MVDGQPSTKRPAPSPNTLQPLSTCRRDPAAAIGALYPVGKNVLYTGKVVPNLAGSSLHFVLQSHPRRRWKRMSTADFAMGSDGTVTVRVRHRNLRVGVSYRLRCAFAGDATHLSGKSPWSYFKVVR
jgi:hypothetical protein